MGRFHVGRSRYVQFWLLDLLLVCMLGKTAAKGMGENEASVLDIAPSFANMAPSFEIVPMFARAPLFTSIVVLSTFFSFFI